MTCCEAASRLERIMVKALYSPTYRIKALVNQPVPYNIDLFNGLAAHRGLEVEVLYLVRHQGGDNQSYRQLPEQRFANRILAGLAVRHAAVNPGVLTELGRSDYDVLLLAGYNHPTLLAALLWASTSGKPWLLWGDTWSEATSRGWLVRALKQLVLRRTFGTALAVLATGQSGADSILRLGCPPALAVNFPYCVDVTRPQRTSAAEEQMNARIRTLAAGRPVALFVGQLVPRKDPETLLLALRILRERRRQFFAVFAGAGPLESKLQALSRSYGLQESVEFTGFLDLEHLAGCYRAADLFVLPSQWDAWGAAVAEAQVWGLPVVSTFACCAARERVKHGENGFLVRPGDATAVANAMDILLHAPARAERFGRRARAIAERWTPDRNAEVLYQLLRHRMPPCIRGAADGLGPRLRDGKASRGVTRQSSKHWLPLAG